MKIAVTGPDYVGLSLPMLLEQKHTVVALDIPPEKIDLLNNKSRIVDDEIMHFIDNKTLNFSATLNKNQAYQYADFVVIANHMIDDLFGND